MYSPAFLILVVALIFYGWYSLKDHFEEIGEKIEEFLENFLGE